MIAEIINLNRKIGVLPVLLFILRRFWQNGIGISARNGYFQKKK
ncbi:hypothetical protein C723_1328 [Christiangramia flava JLT2011]|uniref:Uncharacterized protein n=1 Tax=Christiangramia flava JLT2011 TaxID=1229726 RepID=A0A1L7I8L6_9FLAO|nr:hypothetical protein GRFL_3217 [Christiangramia flava JLT2011]OSS39426.1 hypothetical protein C723_1328 [Christiangramia flava JLT2011]